MLRGQPASSLPASVDALQSEQHKPPHTKHHVLENKQGDQDRLPIKEQSLRKRKYVADVVKPLFTSYSSAWL